MRFVGQYEKAPRVPSLANIVIDGRFIAYQTGRCYERTMKQFYFRMPAPTNLVRTSYIYILYVGVVSAKLLPLNSDIYLWPFLSWCNHPRVFCRVSIFYCHDQKRFSFLTCFLTRVSTRDPTWFLLRYAKNTIFFDLAQVQYVWMPPWFMWSARHRSQAILRITEGVSEVVYVRVINNARQTFTVTAVPRIAGVLSFPASSLYFRQRSPSVWR